MAIREQISTLEDFEQQIYEVVELPAAEGKEDKETLKLLCQKPSLLELAKTGKIPNSLMNEVGDLFAGNKKRKTETQVKSMTNAEQLKELAELIKLIDVLLLDTIVQPEAEKVIPLLQDAQKLFLYNWMLTGVKKLEGFREDESNNAGNKHVQRVRSKTVSDNGNK